LVVGGGMMFLNSDMVDVATYRQDVTVVRVPAVKLATDAGNPRGANVAMIGAFLRRAPLVKRETMEAVIRRVFAEKNEKLAEANVVTLRAGHDWVAEGEAHGS
jgi:2-oxoglutarate ferredoxin oxidoreductase subunit gamma